MPAPRVIKILIADKDKNTRALIKECVLSVFKLSSVLEAHNGTNADYKVVNQPFDLVIISQNIPGKDGVRLLKSFNALELPNKPKCVVLLTDNKIFDESLRQIFEPLYFLAKPCEADALKEVLRETVRVIAHV